MVKVSLTGKKQTTTQALGAGVARWILKAGCGVMVLWNGELLAATVVTIDGMLCCDCPDAVDSLTGSVGLGIPICQCRVYRDTVRQIKSMIGLA